MKYLRHVVSLVLLSTVLVGCSNIQRVEVGNVSPGKAPSPETVASQPASGSTYLYAGAQLSSLPQQVIFTYQGLAAEVSGEIQLAKPYVGGPTGPSPDTAYPAHLRFYFYLDPSAPLFGRERPYLRIYPADAYRLVYGEDSLQQAETPGYIINQTIGRLQAILVDRPQTSEGDLPFLPPRHNAQVFKAQLKYLDFQDGAGIRFLTQYTIGGPINNQDIFYTFQGLTADGQYYISLFYPVSTAALAEFAGDDAFATLEEFQTHVQETTQRLEALSPGDFSPDLSVLDALAQSLQITTDVQLELTPLAGLSIADPQTYTDLELGFSLNYDPSWRLKSQAGTALNDGSGRTILLEKEGYQLKLQFQPKPEVVGECGGILKQGVLSLYWKYPVGQLEVWRAKAEVGWVNSYYDDQVSFIDIIVPTELRAEPDDNGDIGEFTCSPQINDYIISISYLLPVSVADLKAGRFRSDLLAEMDYILISMAWK